MIVASDVGQHQMWCAQFLKFRKPRHWLSSGGLGTMGVGLPVCDRRLCRGSRQTRCVRDRRRLYSNEYSGIGDLLSSSALLRKLFF